MAGTANYKIIVILSVLLLGIALGIFRDAHKDDALYLQDATVMARSLEGGRWFGNEAVGLHGFLFKLPVALVFLVIFSALAFAFYAKITRWLQRSCTGNAENMLRGHID